MISAKQIRAVVFDMGGVLVELGPPLDILGPESKLTEPEFWSKWLASEAVRDFEMGRCETEEFGRRLVVEFGLSMTGAELVERFAQWPKGLMEGAVEMVDGLRGGVQLAVLSNTNALHWQSQPQAEQVQALFDRQYLSYEMGLAKPDKAIFEAVMVDLGLSGEEILFLDDNQINVDGARDAGITSELARGVAQAEAALAKHNLA